MSFQEKSTILTSAVLIAVYGVYLGIVGGRLASAPVEEIVYQPLLVVAVVPLVVLAVFGHIVIAILKPREAGSEDERDRAIALRGERVGGLVLALAVFAGLVLAMVEAHHFYIAHVLLVGWVLAEIAEGVTKVVLYRRGG